MQIKTIKSRDFAQNVTGKYAKGTVNENGDLLTEFCRIKNISIMTTHFKHKPDQLTTWTFPAPINYYRKNPSRNQMGYNTYQKNKNTKVFGAKSYINYNTN